MRSPTSLTQKVRSHLTPIRSAIASEVEVLRVLHGARDLEAILEEDSTEDSEGD